jgi:hypothetical protein
MSADRRELHEVTNARLRRHVHEARLAFQQSLADRRQQQTSFHSSDRSPERLRLVEVADDELSARLLEIARPRRVLNHGADRGASSEQLLDDETSIGAGGARNEDHDLSFWSLGSTSAAAMSWMSAYSVGSTIFSPAIRMTQQ